MSKPNQLGLEKCEVNAIATAIIDEANTQMLADPAFGFKFLAALMVVLISTVRSGPNWKEDAPQTLRDVHDAAVACIRDMGGQFAEDLPKDNHAPSSRMLN